MVKGFISKSKIQDKYIMTGKDYKRHINNYSDDLLRYLAKNLQDIDEAKDILQDAFIALWENRTKIENAKVKSWLFTVAHNKMLKLIRHNKVRQNVLDNGFIQQENERTIKQDIENVQQIDYLLSKLNPTQRQCLTLKEWNGFSIKEIAQIINISEQNVKVNIFRAKIKLKEIAQNDRI